LRWKDEATPHPANDRNDQSQCDPSGTGRAALVCKIERLRGIRIGHYALQRLRIARKVLK
jgi:hypothetical protein